MEDIWCTIPAFACLFELLLPTFPQTPAAGVGSLEDKEPLLLALDDGVSPRRIEVATSKAPAAETRAFATALAGKPISQSAFCSAAHGAATTIAGCAPAGGPRCRVEARVVYSLMLTLTRRFFLTVCQDSAKNNELSLTPR